MVSVWPDSRNKTILGVLQSFIMRRISGGCNVQYCVASATSAVPVSSVIRGGGGKSWMTGPRAGHRWYTRPSAEMEADKLLQEWLC